MGIITVFLMPETYSAWKEVGQDRKSIYILKLRKKSEKYVSVPKLVQGRTNFILLKIKKNLSFFNSWLTTLCQFMLYKVTQSYIYIYIYFFLKKHYFPSWSIPGDWIQFPVLYSRTNFILYFGNLLSATRGLPNIPKLLGDLTITAGVMK